MAEIPIYYSENTIDNIIINVKSSLTYTTDEKNCLCNMLEQMKRENFLLYMVEVYHDSLFNFEILDFEKHKKYLVSEVYSELLEQLIKANIDYEEITYQEVRQWFPGMSIDIDILTAIDKRFKEANVRILY